MLSPFTTHLCHDFERGLCCFFELLSKVKLCNTRTQSACAAVARQRPRNETQTQIGQISLHLGGSTQRPYRVCGRRLRPRAEHPRSLVAPNLLKVQGPLSGVLPMAAYPCRSQPAGNIYPLERPIASCFRSTPSLPHRPVLSSGCCSSSIEQRPSIILPPSQHTGTTGLA